MEAGGRELGGREGGRAGRANGGEKAEQAVRGSAGRRPGPGHSERRSHCRVASRNTRASDSCFQKILPGPARRSDAGGRLGRGKAGTSSRATGPSGESRAAERRGPAVEAERGDRDDAREDTAGRRAERTGCAADEEGGLRGDLQTQI